MIQIVNKPSFEELSPEAQQRYEEQINKNGRITNMKQTLLHSVVAFDALMQWYPLFENLEKFLPKTSALFFAHAISNQNECLICNTFFIKIFRDLEIDIATFEFNEQEQLLIEFGRALVSTPHSIPTAIFTRLKQFFSPKQIIELTAFAGLMIATNLINTALNIPLDEYLYEYQ
ncbi:carboxymuconolactone decarboxylase family protein [Thorsellia kenyensis]|uniref:Carboxymuconolactone decarboxylase family protein n=1 Tax=Thorsellia kenyensis TaxID=1549888 RepID=A0ABV6CCV3_9GAMM